jgi:hypothetical protein
MFAIYFLAQRAKWFSGKNGFDRKPEIFTDLKCKLKAGVKIAAFKIANGLEVNIESIGQFIATQPALGSKHRNPVVQVFPLPNDRYYIDILLYIYNNMSI